MPATSILQPSIWNDIVQLINAPGGYFLLALMLAAVLSIAGLLLDAGNFTIRVPPLKPRRLPFFSDDFAALDHERSATHIIDEQRAKELHNVISISSRRRA